MKINPILLQKVWEKGRAFGDYDPDKWRLDECGAWLYRDHYADVDSQYGWKIARIVSSGGDKPGDLRPLHWNNNYDTGNARPDCHVMAERYTLAAGSHAEPPHNTDLSFMMVPSNRVSGKHDKQV